MKHRLLPFLPALLLACGEGQESYRQASGLSLDGEVIAPVEVSFQLPSRSRLGADAPLLLEHMTGFAYQLTPEGEKCQDSRILEASGPYEDARTFIFKLSASCDYRISIQLGRLASPSLALAKSLNYEDHIKPMLQASCVSCHTEYSDFAKVKASGAAIVASIEDESMPPESPLDATSIALFLAWADGGYQEKDPRTAEKEAAAPAALSEIFFLNNNDDVLKNYELIGRTTFELRRTLWVQAAAKSLGVERNELTTFKTSGD